MHEVNCCKVQISIHLQKFKYAVLCPVEPRIGLKNPLSPCLLLLSQSSLVCGFIFFCSTCVRRMYLLLKETHNFVKFQFCRWTIDITMHIPTPLVFFALLLIYLSFTLYRSFEICCVQKFDLAEAIKCLFHAHINAFGCVILIG